MKLLSIAACAAAIVALASCGSKKETTQAQQAAADSTIVSLNGTYNVYTININDSVSVEPAQATPGELSSMTFSDGHYTVQTNCNTIQGDFTQKGDSIHFSDGLKTMMACPNTEAEDLMVQVLPRINKVVVLNDTVTRLDSDGPAYIVLTPAK